VLAVAAALVKDGEAIAAAGFFQVRAREIGGEVGGERGLHCCGWPGWRCGRALSAGACLSVLDGDGASSERVYDVYMAV
jgi:hypothetical protein